MKILELETRFKGIIEIDNMQRQFFTNKYELFATWPGKYTIKDREFEDPLLVVDKFNNDVQIMINGSQHHIAYIYKDFNYNDIGDVCRVLHELDKIMKQFSK